MDERFQLMRKSTVSQSEVTGIGGTSVVVVPYSDTRVALTLWTDSGTAMFYSLINPAVLASAFSGNSSNQPLSFNIFDDGAIVRGPIYAICLTPPGRVGVWEAHVQTL